MNKTTTPHLRQSAKSADHLLAEIKSDWGIADFRPLQAEALEAQLLQQDSLVIMPTGGGKSLCFQAPARYSPGATVVVSPLIALMKDQVDQLTALGIIPAAFLNSTQPPWQADAIQAAFLKGGGPRLLYVSPERFCTPAFMALLLKADVSAIVVDEAHCVSQWGHDFRPAYLELGRAIAAIRQQKPEISLHACTATASPVVRLDIINNLFPDVPLLSESPRDSSNSATPLILEGSFDRPNLFLRAEEFSYLGGDYAHNDEFAKAVDYINEHPDQPGIVYCSTRRDTEELCNVLNERDLVRAAFYHAGMSDEDRKMIQDAFMAGAVDVVVATVAFGMGINKPDVRYVLHVGMPNHLDLLHQEIGRAGRDGKPAECVVFWSEEDYDWWINVMFRDEDGTAELTNGEGEPKLRALDAMHAYCRTPECRRQVLLQDHFGQRFDPPCGNCDNCQGATVGTTVPRATVGTTVSKAEGGPR